MNKLVDKVIEEHCLGDNGEASTTFAGHDKFIECGPPRLTRPSKVLSDIESHKNLLSTVLTVAVRPSAIPVRNGIKNDDMR